MDSGEQLGYSGSNGGEGDLPLTVDLIELERKLIPLLNRVHKMLGKPPVIVPKER